MAGGFLQRQPGGSLEPFVERIWCCHGYAAAHRRERVLPNGRIQLIVDLARPAPPLVIGMQTGYSVIETAQMQSLIGVVFRPGGARPFFDLPAGEFANRVVPLHAIWGGGAACLRARLQETPGGTERIAVLEAALQERLAQRRGLHAAVEFGLDEFARNPCARGVIEVARNAGLSRRRFAGLFREQVGLAPKLYCRLRRFQQVVRRIAAGAPVDWAELALDGGYCDQAHMANEFRDFAGVSPGAWLASERPFRNHAVLD